MHTVVFAIAAAFIIAFSLLGAVVAATIVAQNWRPIIYFSAIMVAMALIAAAWRAL